MKTVIGNWETDIVTTIDIHKDKMGFFITPRQLVNALVRMNAGRSVKLRFVPVAGAKLATHEFDVREAVGE